MNVYRYNSATASAAYDIFTQCASSQCANTWKMDGGLVTTHARVCILQNLVSALTCMIVIAHCRSRVCVQTVMVGSAIWSRWTKLLFQTWSRGCKYMAKDERRALMLLAACAVPSWLYKCVHQLQSCNGPTAKERQRSWIACSSLAYHALRGCSWTKWHQWKALAELNARKSKQATRRFIQSSQAAVVRCIGSKSSSEPAHRILAIGSWQPWHLLCIDVYYLRVVTPSEDNKS